MSSICPAPLDEGSSAPVQQLGLMKARLMHHQEHQIEGSKRVEQPPRQRPPAQASARPQRAHSLQRKAA